MGLDVLSGRRRERRRETIIDGFDNRLNSVASSREGGNDLRLPHSAVFDVAA